MPYPKSSQTTKDAATQTSEEDTTTSTISTQTSSSEILHGAFDYASTLPHFYTQSSVIPSNLNITEIPATNPIYHFQLGLSLPTQATQKPRDSPVSPHIIINKLWATPPADPLTAAPILDINDVFADVFSALDILSPSSRIVSATPIHLPPEPYHNTKLLNNKPCCCTAPPPGELYSCPCPSHRNFNRRRTTFKRQ